MYIFKKTPDDQTDYDHATVKMSTPTESLPELVEAFHYFLLAAGFKLEGLEIIHEEIDNVHRGIFKD